jgi:hypothetical protein
MVHIVTAGLRVIQHVLPLTKSLHVTHQTKGSLFTVSTSQQQCGLFPVTNFSQHVSLFPYTSTLDSKHSTRVVAKFCGVPLCAVEKSGCAMDRAWGHVMGFWPYYDRPNHRNGPHCTGLLAVLRPSSHAMSESCVVQRLVSSLNPNAVLTAGLVGHTATCNSSCQLLNSKSTDTSASVQVSTAEHEFSWQHSAGLDWRQWQPFFPSLQLVSKVYPFSYPVGISRSLSVVKAAVAWYLPLTAIYYRNKNAWEDVQWIVSWEGCGRMISEQ